MPMNICARAGIALSCVAVVACSSSTGDATGPTVPPPITPSDTTTLQIRASASHTRITTPGVINITIVANKDLDRAEVYNGTTKVSENLAPERPYVVSVPITASNNGTQTYVVKAYDLANKPAQSGPMTVVVDIRWDFVYAVAGVHSHDATLVATDASDAVYVAGTTDTWDVFVVKYDARGNRLWIRTIGGPDAERANSIGIDASGRIFIAANGFSPPLGSGNCFLAIYDSDGNLVRTQQIGGLLAGQTFGCVAASDVQGNFYLTGSTSDSTQGHGLVIKYDRDGAELWTQKFGGTPFPSSEFPNDAPTSIAVDPLGGVYVGGYTGQSFDGQPNRGQRDTFVLKYDGDGNRLWSAQYGTSGVLTFGDQLAADPDGGVYISGQTDDPNRRFVAGNGFVLRFSAAGALLWARILDGGGNDRASGVAADLRGVYVVGNTNRGGPNQDMTEPTQGGSDGFLAQLSRDGNLLSMRLFGSPANEAATRVVVGVNGDIYVAGFLVYDQAAVILTPMFARHRDPTP